MIDFDRIAETARERAGSLIPSWIPGGKWQGREWVARNPLRADAHPGSFSVNRESFKWADFATGDKGGDAVSLFAYLHSVSQGDAARRLAEEFGLNGYHANGGPDGARAGRKPSLTIEELARAKGLPLDFLKKHGVEQSGRFVKFTYYGADSGPAPRYRLRQKLTGKNKTIWNPKDERPISLYGAETLRPSPGAVLDLVEGETDRLSALLHGRNALGLPGASTARLIQPEHIAGFDEALIYHEPDTGGPTLRKGVLKRLGELGFQGAVKVIHMPADVKDLNGLHVRWLGEPGAFESELEELLRSAEKVELDGPSPQRTEDEPRPPEFSDDELALQFAAARADDLRFIAEWNRWFMWDGCRWSEDKTLHAFDHVRHTCRQASTAALAKIEDPAKAMKLAFAIASNKTVAAVHSLCRTDRRLAGTVSQWDADPMLLNTPGGTVDLNTGELRSHRKAEYQTKRTAVTPAEVTRCPLWLQSLEQIFGGDQELIAYVQRAAGYSLTGLVTEQVLFFLFGFGGNGKNVVAETLAGVAGDYAVVAPMGLLIEQRHEQHPTELAVLLGARMALGSEVDPGKGWAEAKLKALTGGDRITARYMRGDFFEFDPHFKFWLRANHKPRLRSIDAAMMRRLHLLPFGVRFEGAERDPYLNEKLRQEWPGILRWGLDGCLAWQRGGLKPPASVNQATETYFADFNVLDRWLDDCCVENVNAKGFTRPLFVSWRVWAERNNERIGSEAEFVERLEARGFKRFREGIGRGFKGLGLRADPQQADGLGASESRL